MSSALLFTLTWSSSNFFTMYRHKILQKYFSIYKPKLKYSSLPTDFKGNILSSVNQNIFYKNAETIKFFKGFSFFKKFPTTKISKMYVSQLSESTCWKCNANSKIKNFTCSQCGALQPPKPDINYFELLGVSQSFEINLEHMTEKFRSLQMVFHPDKVENKSQTEKEISENYSRLLNKAYKTLKDPVSRGLYLLEFNNVLSKTENPLDPNFLSVIMEKNEELETIDNLSSLNNFTEINDNQIKEQLSLIQKAFNNNEFLNAKLNLLRLNYLLKLNEKIKEKEAKFPHT